MASASGTFLALAAYRTYVLPALIFVAQLCPFFEDWVEVARTFRTLLPTYIAAQLGFLSLVLPEAAKIHILNFERRWISAEDVCHLQLLGLSFSSASLKLASLVSAARVAYSDPTWELLRGFHGCKQRLPADVPVR